MVLSNIQIFNHLGFAASTAAARNAIIEDFLSGGLEGLQYMSEEDVKETCSSYAKRSDGSFPIILTVIQRQRLKSLVMWVKDMVRAQQPISFPNGMTAAQLRQELQAAIERDRMRKDQKKIGESYLDHKFVNQLKNQSQWEKFYEELISTLSLIIGSQGVTLNYVVRDIDTSTFDVSVTYDEAIIQAVAVNGPRFLVDARTVHQIIINNIVEDSDAYTYVKPLLRNRNGRQDIQALKERYSSDASKQGIINNAKATLDTLRYKNERSFPFEKFSSRLQKAYDELEDNGRPVNNGDIVDDLWSKIQDASLQTYVAALRVDYLRNPRNYKLILQDIASDIASKKRVTFSLPPGNNRTLSAVYTREGPPPNEGVYKPDGSVYIGMYDANKWRSATVQPHHKEIIDARSRDSVPGGSPGGGQSRTSKRRANAVKRGKRKIKKLQEQLQISAARIASLENASEQQGDDNSNGGNNAGNEFGGRRSRNGAAS